MTQYMLLFSIGPVQTFIAQARKTRDLWLGSFLLSALMQVSMEGIESKLIFPFDPVIRDNIPDLPNKYIAIFDSVSDAVKAAGESEGKIKQFWQKICSDVWDAVLEKPARFSPVTRAQWDKQINPANLFEIFWVAVEGDREHYSKWLKETQSTFDRRKHLRNFQQQEESGEKSTISGLRSALCGVGELRSDVQTFWYEIAKEQSTRDISTDGTERLDAIDTVKRFAFKSFAQLEVGFPSTSSIAVASFLERLILASQANDPHLSKDINNWLKESRRLGDVMPATIPYLTVRAGQHEQSRAILKLDGDCLFPETFHPQRLKKEFGFDDTRAEERAKLAKSGPDALSNLLKATDGLSILRPTPYYAMIQMDGDKMGVLINGVQSQEEHQSINRAMSNFARKHVSNLIEDSYPGRLIYAGGDDVFALAPLARDLPVQDREAPQIRTVLDLVDQLQQQYRNVVQQVVVDSDRKTLVTASTGIAIAHHYTSLSYVRRSSKEAEELAKNHYGRNALVVTVLRRSGEQTRVGCRWCYPNLAEEGQPIQLFSSFFTLFKDDVLSPKCVHILLEEAPVLVGLDLSAQKSEVKRVLSRQLSEGKKNAEREEQLKRLAEYVVDLAKAMDDGVSDRASLEVELHANARRHGIVETLGWLLVMAFLARKEQE